MTTLAEIEAAAEALSPAQKQELLLFLAASLRDQEVPLPDARKFSPEQLAEWIARDKAHMKELRGGA
jgi:hypothetical protein